MKKIYTLLCIVTVVIFSQYSQFDIQDYSNHQPAPLELRQNILPPPSNCLASPYPTLIQQSDGTMLTIVGKGNMNNNWIESTDGYTLTRNSQGVYEYANKVNGNLIPSGIKAREVQSRTSTETSFLSTQPLGLKPTLNPLKTSILSQVLSNVQNKTYPTTGNLRILALLIDYPDMPNIYSKTDFDSLTSAANYRNGDHSFKTFYETASNGEMTITVDVKGWYTADSNFVWYGSDSSARRAADLVREAVDSAELDGVDFSLYDNDGDFDADGILVVHAGPGAEQGAQGQYIWSHRWVMNGGTSGAVTYDGTFINDYIINPEIRTAGTANNLVGIGVFCHEFGHNIGLPDLYDTDGNNGTSAGNGEWALMASAGWLGGEHQPGNFCAWSRINNGWDTPTDLVIGNTGNYTLNPASLHQDEIYRINTSLSNEYFLLENRQKTGIDTALRGEGLAVWHINTNKLSSTNLFFNNVNADENLKAVDLEEADGRNDLDANINRGDNGDLYPGSSNNNTFDDASTPNAKSYTNVNSNIEIRNISESGQTVSFSFGPAPGPPCAASSTLTTATASFSDGSGNLDYANGQNCSWLIQPTGATSITLNFTNFDTELNTDSLTVYDGTSNTAAILGNFSGNTLPAAVSSTGGDMYIEFNTNPTINSAGWDANYTSSSGPGCTGTQTLTNATDTFDDGSGGNNYTNNLACTWLIQPVGATRIQLDFLSFATDTINDSIAIYAGNSLASPLVASYSGGSIPPSIVVNGNSMLVEFITDGSVTDAGWEARYVGDNPACSGTIIKSLATDTIEDGSGNSDYANNLNCGWHINPTGATSITLSFLEFDTDTIIDSVAIYDGSSNAGTLIASYSGSSLPPDVKVSGKDMFVEFITDGSTTAPGWKAVYTSKPSCRGTVAVNTISGRITDGSGKEDYDNNVSCGWHIEPPNNPNVITFRMDTINLANFGDRIRVYDGRDNTAPLLGQYFLNFLGNPVSATSGEMFIEFITDASLTGNGWSGSFVSGSTYCIGNSTLTAESGNLSDGSPIFVNYANNTNCSWLIQPSTPNRLITVNFPFPTFNFNTEANRDSLTFYDGPTTSDPIIRTISGNPSTISPITSSGGSMLITFKTDGNNTRRGWRGNYTTAPDPTCSGRTTFTAANATFDDGSLPNVVYTEDNDCSWLIEPIGAKVVSLQFNRFETEGSNDFVHVYDGANASATLIGSYSGNLIPPAIVSSDSALFVEFKTNGTDNRLGWEATYNSSTDQCIPNLTLTSVRDTITDGSDTNDYENNLSCNWLIEPPTATSISLDFIEFDLNDPGDSLKVYDGNSTSSPILGVFSGSTLPNSLTSSGGTMFIEFITDASIVDKGWKVYYDITTTLSCIGTQTLTATAATFGDGSGINDNYDNNLNCGWLIQPTGTVNAIQFVMDSMVMGNGDVLHVYDGSSASSTLLKTYTSFDNTPIVGNSGSLFVEFITDNASVGWGWEATYTSSSTFCFPLTVFTEPQGSFSDGSPTNQNYRNNTDCSWLINPAGNVGINLRWLRFNTQPGTDTVTVYDGNSTNDPVLGTFSGRRGNIVNSTGNEMLVTFKTNGGGVRSGWQANYRTFDLPLCNGSTTFTTATGTFDDGSGNGTDYGPNSNCSWLIQPTGALSVDLTFNYFSTQATFDVVTVYDGSSNTDPVLGAFSGSTIPSQLNSTGASMLVEFSSNNAINDNGWEVTYTANTTVNLSANPDTITINDPNGSSNTFDVLSNVAWTTSTNVGWLSVSPINGNLNQTVTATATAPNLGPDRFAEVYINSTIGGKSDTVIVKQLAPNNFMTVTPDTIYFLGNPNGSQNINISANVSWNLSNNATWLTANPINGSNNGAPALTAAVNATNQQRLDTVVISSAAAVINDTVIVFQDSAIPPPPSLSVNPSNIALAQSSGSSSSFTINSTVLWQTTSGASWLTVTNPTITRDTNTVQITANSMNVSVNSRSTFVAVQNNAGTLFDTVFVTQNGGTLILNPNPSSVTLNETAGSNAAISLSSNLIWTATSGAAWLDVNPKSGNGNGSLTVDALTANLSTSPRNSFIALEGAAGAVLDTIFVTQLGTPRQLSVNPTFLSLGQGTGSTGNFIVNSNVIWQTTAGAPWISITNPAVTQDTAAVQISANTMNPSTNPRSSFVAVQDNNGTLFDTVFVDQLGSNPVLSANPDTIFFLANPVGSQNINISANVSWNLSKNATWLSSNVSGGANSGTAVLTATVNTSNLQRLDTVILSSAAAVNNDTVIVFQDTAIPPPQSLSVNPSNLTLAGNSGASSSFSVISNVVWQTTSGASWLTVTNPTITKDTKTVQITANSNNVSGSNRSTFVAVQNKAGTLFDTLFVTQNAISINFSLNPSTVTLNQAAGSTSSVSLNSNISWTATSSAAWLDVNPKIGNGNGNLIVEALTNNLNTATRSSFIALDGGSGAVFDTIFVTQLGVPSQLSVNPINLSIGQALGSTNNFTVNSNVSWQTTAGAPWISITNPTSTQDTGVVQISANSMNPNTNIRSSYVAVQDNNGTLFDTVFVDQLGANPVLSANPDTLFFLANPLGSQNINISANVSWNLSNNATWAIVSPSSGSNIGLSSVSVAINPTTADRLDTIVLSSPTGNPSAIPNDTIILVQEGLVMPPPVLDVNPTNLTLNQNAGSNASVNLTSNLSWTLRSGALWLDANPKNGNGNGNLVVEALTNNLSTSPRSSFIAIDGGAGTILDTIFVTQLGAANQLSVTPKNVSIAQPLGSSVNFTINSNVSWQTSAGATWITLLNPPLTQDTGTVIITANSMNTSTIARSSYVAVQDINGTLFDTVLVNQLGTAPTLGSNPDTLILEATINSSGNANVVSNGNWTALSGDPAFSLNASSGSGNNAIVVATTADNLGSNQIISFLALEDAINGLRDSVVLIQDTIIPGLRTEPDTIRLLTAQGSTNSFDIISSGSWNATPNVNWFSVSQISGNGNRTINVTANSDNSGLTERIGFAVIKSTSGPSSNDTVYVIQESAPISLSVTPSNIILNSALGSNAQINIKSNQNWVVNNPVNWLAVAPSLGVNDGSSTITALSENLSGSNRTATLRVSTIGASDQLVTVTQIDGSTPQFDVSKDTIYLDNPQGSTANFTVVSNVNNWNISENTSWILVNPQSGSNTVEVTVLVATRNAFGNARSTQLTVSANGFSDKTVTVIQKESIPLFNIAPTMLILGNDSADYVSFNVSSNMTAWGISESASWMEVSPDTGAFTQQIMVSASETNNSGNVRTDVITIIAPPLIPQTIMVTQDTARTIGLDEIELLSNVSIYPNPTRDIVSVAINGSLDMENVNVQLFDMLGQSIPIQAENTLSNQFILDISSLSSGVYFLRLSVGSEIISRKLIKSD